MSRQLILGHNVNCFYSPFWSSDGRMRHNLPYLSDAEYDVGDEVPYKTWWYDYTKNFNIIDTYSDDMIFIRDGKVSGIKKLGDVESDDLRGAAYTLEDVGKRLSIPNLDTLREFDKAILKWATFLNDLIREDRDISKEMHDMHDQLFAPFELTEPFDEVYELGGLLHCFKYCDNLHSSLQDLLISQIKKLDSKFPRAAEQLILINKEDRVEIQHLINIVRSKYR